MKRLSRPDDRPGTALGLVYPWDLVPAVNEYIEFDLDPDPEWWRGFADQVAADVAIARTIPDVRKPLGPAV
ncbi:hypothetical protein ACFV9C_26015 [Kribbella sp. NPDC059898]|uniref:hypothetical protein n=1 Tax=Kribbella sp. NPDC059898 TaxID=3346995 RepID=UPI0036522712